MAKSGVIRELLIAIGVELDADGLRRARTAVDTLKDGVGDLAKQDVASSKASASAARARAASARADTAGIRKTAAERAAAAKALKATEAAALRATKRENAALKAQERQARGVAGAFRDLSDAFKSLAMYAAGAAASIGAVVGVAIANSHGIAIAAAETERLATAFGSTSAELVGLNLAMRSVGGDSNDAADILGTLADRAQDAKDGMQSFIDDFALARVSVKDLEKLRPHEIMELFADGIAKVEDPTKRTAAVVRILGDDLGRKVLPMMLEGADAFRAFKQQAIETGQVLDKEAIAATKEYLKTTQRLSSELEGTRTIIGAALLPAVKDLAEVTLQAAIAMRKMVQAGVARWGDQVTEALRTVGQFAKRNYVLFGLLAASIVGVTVAIGGFIASVAIVTALSSAFAALGTVIASVAAAAAALGAVFGGGALLGAIAFLPLIAAGIASTTFALAPLVIGIALAVLALDDLHKYLTGGESAIGNFLAAWTGTDTAIGAAIEMFKSLGDVVFAVGDLLRATGHIIIEVLRPAFEWIAEKGASALDTITDAFTSLGDTILWLFDTVLGTKLASSTGGLKDLVSMLGAATSGVEMIGGMLGVAPQNAIPAAAGAGGNQSMSQNNTYNIASTDPTGAAREVGANQATGMRAAKDFFSGGVR